MIGGGLKFSLVVLVVAWSCSLAQGCGYRDACSPDKTFSAKKGSYFQDSCPRIFRVNHDCSLTFIGQGFCTYIDACDDKIKIEARLRETFQDSCANKFKVESLCELKFAGPGDCEAIDECSGEVIKGLRGRTFTDSCPNVNRFAIGCEVEFVKKGTCEFTDDCNGETISAQVGDTITDSCGDTYIIEEQCEKVFVPPPTPTPTPLPSGRLVVTVDKARNLPDRDGFFSGKSDPYVKVTAFDVDGQSKVLKTSIKDEDHNPVWDESLDFGERGWSTIKVEIFDRDRLGRDDDRLLPSKTVDIGEPVADGTDPTSVRICDTSSCNSFLLLEYLYLD